MKAIFFVVSVFIFFAGNSYCQTETKTNKFEQSEVYATYNKTGLVINTKSNNFSSDIGIRFQFRFFTPIDDDPRSIDGFTDDIRPTLFVRRARLKMKGHVWEDYLTYNFEYDFVVSRLLNAYMSIEKFKGFNVRIGQYKTFYNRERVISSADQTLIERSISNRAFTVDRQVGASFYGNFGADRFTNFDYAFSIHTGTGSLATLNDDKNMMYIGRLQWNFLGSPIPIGESASSTKEHETLRAGIAVVAATNISPYTRFSSSGGSQLDDFLRGEPGQYKVDQISEDLMIKYQGVSLLHELHYKKIDNRIDSIKTDMRGIMIQLGFYPGYLIDGVTKNLEFAVRYAYNDENTSANVQRFRDEFTVGANYYFNGFRHRIQTDFSLLDMRLPTETINTYRFRIQWDITF